VCFNLGPRAVNMLQAQLYLNLALTKTLIFSENVCQTLTMRV